MSQVFSDFQILQTHLQQCCENENMCVNFHEKEYMAKYYKNVKHKGKGKKNLRVTFIICLWFFYYNLEFFIPFPDLQKQNSIVVTSHSTA